MNPTILRYAISDRNVEGEDGQGALLRQATRLAATGVDFFQIREKDLPAGEQAALCRAVLAAAHGSSLKVIVNGRLDVAAAVGAHGVHLTSGVEELSPAEVRRVYAGAGLAAPVVTVSCHTVAAVGRRGGEKVDAILFGPVFEKVAAGKRLRDGSGLALLREACAAAGATPVLALGGVTAANTALCLEAGAAGVAGIRLFH